jgi:hypothetical protein
MNDIKDLKPNIIIGDSYEGVLTLNAWKGFQSRQGFYGSQDKLEGSDYSVRVSVEGKEVDNVMIATLPQVNAIQFLVNKSEKVRDAVLVGLLNELPNLKEIYEDLLPDIISIEDFKNVIGLSNLHVLSSDKDDCAYVGFELGCSWDDEHGVGVMTHKDRVVAIGQADTSFDSWVAFDDNGTTEIETEKWREANAKLQKERQKVYEKKSWWKFWQNSN